MDSLSKNIRKNINEVKQSQKNRIVESTIINNRYNTILKNSKNRRFLFANLIGESKKLTQLGFDKKLIVENLMDLFKIFFKDNKGLDIISSFKIENSEILIEKIGLEQNSLLSNAINKTFSERDDDDSAKIFTDVDFLSEKIVSNMIDEFGFKNQGDKENMTRVLEKEVKILVKPHMDEINNKMNNKFEDIKMKSLSD